MLAGIGNLTLSQATDVNGGTITISAGTAAAGGATISASDQPFSTGTVVITGAGGGVPVDHAGREHHPYFGGSTGRADGADTEPA